MKHTWKKTTAFIMALALVAGFSSVNVGGFLTGGTAIVASAAEAETEEPAAVGATVERNGLTYFNTYSKNTDSAEMFYCDLIDAKTDSFKNTGADGKVISTNNYSLGEMWLMMASGCCSNKLSSSAVSISQRWVVAELAILKVEAPTALLLLATRHWGVQFVVG